MLITGLIALSMLVAAIVGWQVGKVRKAYATVFAALVCVLLVCGAYLSHHPAELPEFALCPLTCYLQTSWYAPLATVLFYLAASQSFLRSAENQRTLAKWARMQVMLGFLCTAILYAAAAPTLFEPEEILSEINNAQAVNGKPPDRGTFVRQTLNYTCGPSACATLLRASGIDANATEAEMAVLCLTRPHAGSSVLGLAAGLKTKASPQGWHVKIVAPDWRAFMALRKPVVCAMTFNGSPHVVAVLETDPQKGINVADPIGFLGWTPIEEFKREFNGEVVAVFRQDPFEKQ